MNLTTNKTTKEIQDDIVIYLAAARIAFEDAKVFDAIADQLGIADAEMIRLRKSLEEYLDEIADFNPLPHHKNL